MDDFKRMTKRGTALLLTLALCSGMACTSALAADGEGTGGERSVLCGKSEHTHGEGCYESTLSCEQVESEEHAHDDACYTQAVACEQEEHAHGEACCFRAEKVADWEFTISGSGEFKGEFMLNGEQKSIDTLGYAAIRKVTFKEGVTSIGSMAFSRHNCMQSLEEVVLPSTLTVIGEKAFYSCYNLKSINLENVTSVGAQAFDNNDKLETLDLSSMTEIGPGAFKGMKGLKSLILPEGMTSIGEEAFMLCRGLEEVALPSTITSIGDRGFSNCTALRTVEFPSGLTYIGTGAFESCLCLEDVDIHVVGDLKIGDTAFYALNVNSISIVSDKEHGVTIGQRAFGVTRGAKDVTIKNAADIGDYAFWGTGAETVTIDGAASIGKYAFYGYYNESYSPLRELSIEDVETIGQQAFAYCTALTALSLENVGIIGQQAFMNCTSLPAVIMGKVGTINPYAFLGCASLTSIDSLANVDRIDGFAFYNCPNLTGLTVEDLTKMGYNGNYADVMDRVQAILNGTFKLDAAPGIAELVPADGWDDSKTGKSDDWDTYGKGTQLVEQARWIDEDKTQAEVKVDAYYTASKQMDYIFVADLSASMAQLGNAADQNSRFYDMQSKLLDMTGQLLGSEGYDCRVAIVTFGGALGTAPGTFTTMGFTSDASSAKAHINALAPLYENTDYGLGMQEALRLVQANAGRDTVVIFLSDGEPNQNGSGDQDGTVAAGAIKALNVPIYGVLHSPGTAHDAALAKMQAVCGGNTVFESTDTASFGEAMNEAFTAVYPDQTVTIPVNEAFEDVRDLSVSVAGGEAAYDAAAHTITWTISGMPFTKHTLTYKMDLTEEEAAKTGEQSFDVNSGKAVMAGGAEVESPVLARAVSGSMPVVPEIVVTPEPSVDPAPVESEEPAPVDPEPSESADPEPSEPVDPAPVESEPDEDIEESAPPQGELPSLPVESEDPAPAESEPDEDIEESAPPQGELPDLSGDPDEEIVDPEPPMADAPKTGDGLGLWIAAAAVSGAGLASAVGVTRKRKESEEEA